jgi:pimeloyl-ACP methyl ester carboxylesterase
MSPVARVNEPIVTEDVVTILDWPTDVVSIDYVGQRQRPHTYLLFVPGNPGLVGWYISALTSILRNLGPGFAVRGISHAGHGITEETVHVEPYKNSSTGNSSYSQPRNVQIPWTINGQIQHKMAWMESLREVVQSPQRLIFLSHSIGAHMVQRLLVLRKDWRDRTSAIVHWMPFLRMEAPTMRIQMKLDTVAQHPDCFIGIGTRLLQVTPRWVKEYILKSHVPDPKGLVRAVDLVEHATFVTNFLELGTEEIRDMPQLPDVSVWTVFDQKGTRAGF